MVTSLHHIGCIVSSIADAIEDYRILYPTGETSEIFAIEDQQVKVCFFSIGETKIEFVEPGAKNATLLSILEKKPGFYHIGLHTANIEAEIERLENNGYRKISQFRSEAFGGRWCAFMYNREMHLVELIEAV